MVPRRLPPESRMAKRRNGRRPRWQTERNGLCPNQRAVLRPAERATAAAPEDAAKDRPAVGHPLPPNPAPRVRPDHRRRASRRERPAVPMAGRPEPTDRAPTGRGRRGRVIEVRPTTAALRTGRLGMTHRRPRRTHARRPSARGRLDSRWSGSKPVGSRFPRPKRSSSTFSVWRRMMPSSSS